MATLEAARAHLTASTLAQDSAQLRVLTCGSVDDGKSTLLGRLLFDTHSIADDQLSALDRESRRWGTQGEAMDYALLLDGLSAEREQGITIDVAYRYFSTARRSFIVADTPGHEQYTRNMATGASQADLAIILVDARKGVLAQTRRHAFIVATLGVRHAVLAVNKMDLADFSQARFDEIVTEFGQAASMLGFQSIVPIPLVARDGDNLATRSARMEWYNGPTLLDHLETVDATPPAEAAGFLLPIQLVLRPDSDFRGYAGTVAQGSVRVGDAVVALPSGRKSTVARVITSGRDQATAGAGEAVTIALSGEIDIARGDVLASAADAPRPTSRLEATLLWMDDDAMSPTRDYALLLGPASAGARVSTVRHAVDIETYREREASTLWMNEIGAVSIEVDRAVIAASYRENRALGAFILVDRASNRTVALGVVDGIGPEAATTPTRRLDSRAVAHAVLSTLTLGSVTLMMSGDAAVAVGVAGANVVVSAILNRIVAPR